MSLRRALNTRERGLSYDHSRVHHSVCQALYLVPIHRDTQLDLNTEKGGLVKKHKKGKLKTKKKRNRRPEAKESVFLGFRDILIGQERNKEKFLSFGKSVSSCITLIR
jgi:hypothetical protein